jgi:hypothetical protein
MVLELVKAEVIGNLGTIIEDLLTIKSYKMLDFMIKIDYY